MSFDFIQSGEFFERLYLDSRFCEGIGKVMLAAGKLETSLRIYLKSRNVNKVRSNSTLGRMVVLLKENNLLSSNGEMHFDDLAKKRNYLAHSLFDLFSKEIEETILPREELVEMDVEIYSDRAHELAEDFMHFANKVKAANSHKGVLL
jgi:hypothetical protein